MSIVFIKLKSFILNHERLPLLVNNLEREINGNGVLRFDIKLIKEARLLGDMLIVGINSDEWLARKKGQAFMPFSERAEILRNIVGVDFVIDFNDSDGSAKHAIIMARQSYPQDHIIFANGGDRTNENIPEMDIVDDNITFAFGVGGEHKMNSSSWILHNYYENKTNRSWGHYRVLYEAEGTKVKELTVNPGQSLSMQRHEHRNEYWHVVEGEATVCESRPNSAAKKTLYKHHSVNIPSTVWHKLSNETDKPLQIVEIQWGTKCVEEDIERR